MFDPADYGLTFDELPTWMRPRPRGIDWPLLVVLVFCLIVAWPMIVRDGLPNSPEATLQMYRIYSVAESIQAGDFYPRWAPDFTYGYGSPLFNYLAPLPYYLSGMHSTIAQAEPYTSFKVVFVSSIFVGGIGLFSFMRQRWGASAGVFGTAIFLFSPYMLQTGPYLQSDLGAAWALALFPVMIWTLDRAFQLGRGRELLALSLSGAGLLLTDYALAPMLFAAAGGWMLWMMLFNSKPLRWQVAMGGYFLALGLAAFYVLPARWEANDVNWQAVAAYPSELVNPAETSDLLATLPPLDQSAVNPAPNFQLGIATWMLAALGATWVAIGLFRLLRKQPQPQQSQSQPSRLQSATAVSFFIPLAVLLFRLVLNPENKLVGGRPFDPLKPIDLLGPLTLCCAILAGQVLVMIEQIFRRPLVRFAGLGICLGVLGISSANAFYIPSLRPVENSITVSDLLEVELRGHAIGSFRQGYLLPKNVAALPQPSTALLTSYNDERISKVDNESLPPFSLVSINAHGPTHDALGIETREDSTVTILTLNYPGWHAERNNRTVTIESLGGLIQVPLEAGSNNIVVSFGSTGPRTLSSITSALALLVAIGLSYWLDRNVEFQAPSLTTSWLWTFRQEQKLMLTLTVTALVVLSLYLRSNVALITATTPSSSAPASAESLRLIVDGGIGFLGYEIDSVDDTLIVKGYWRANRPNLPNYQVAIQLLAGDPSARTGPRAPVYETHYRHVASWPTNLWPTEGYITSVYLLQLPDGFANGTYTIALQVETCDRIDLQPCAGATAHNIFNLQGALGAQILLPTPITIEN
jgi:hypothetical protein